MSEHKQASLQEIFNALLEGKQLTVEFPTMQSAQNFRKNIYTYKGRSNKQLESVGVDAEKQTLAFSAALLSANESGPVRATMCLIPKQTTMYTIVAVSEPENAQVSSNLGKD